jgi:hypothetical protein
VSSSSTVPPSTARLSLSLSPSEEGPGLLPLVNTTVTSLTTGDPLTVEEVDTVEVDTEVVEVTVSSYY